MTVSLERLNACSDSEFVSALGGIFEHSPWVAEAVVGKRPFASVAALHAAMVAAIEAAGTEAQLKLIRAHPDLAGKAALAGELTAESSAEQKGAGLDRLTPGEYERFHALNDRYKERFGFPFILAVRGHDKHSILGAFERRLKHSPEEERAEALAQIARIGEFRLNDLVGE
ncbi:2-oxo-4-hydroxy-4-carboxy-5-ureidoimidazoline decarboxylase [Oricola thermophila]|uniref:2-oxo-4-hydroxy-4-carboxy-5-ureidoimidazoline decarboxylase n=1 Tax=Oricola thermophila TaxID=2742145 RepID=A0A6N1VGJ0_9HYPH|nr:2-oxo-4-hydroxy-4-carboxy-5-ureidoimidazoline decarboxylase [Oricola thermophila]QKV18785.1 2-oxo-4-hydroxy-4-carboxy-5-ureidoimidazoline decarboxylase [Oricola thermophila]